eukprot:TRINITY_DN4387_c0_g1_i1.p1 TRINITY_DN4387_c0_g1~~TRINITY_DN4387_c0_g1_i1.p1  ORF type:complete len:1645 (-),score=450.30 TRINITY_DN4387_c0_g1_i1:888-5822(-)
MTPANKKSLLDKMKSFFDYAAGGNYGIASVAKKDAAFKSKLAGIDSFVYHFDCENTVADGKENPFWTYVVSGNILLCCHNLKEWNKTPSGAAKKIPLISWSSSPLPAGFSADDLPPSLRSDLDRSVGPATDVVVEQPDTNREELQPVAGVNAASSSSSAQSDSSSVTGDEFSAPHLPCPSPFPPTLEQYLGKDLRLWISQEKKFKAAFKKAIRVTFDWEFLSAPEFQSMDDRTKLDVYSAVVGSAGYFAQKLGLMCSDPLIRAAIQQVDRIIYTLCPRNSVTEDENYFRIWLEDADLKVLLNMDKRKSNFTYLEEKINMVLDLRLASAKRDWEASKENLHSQLASVLQKRVPIEVDFAFASHPLLDAMQPEPYFDMVASLWRMRIPDVMTHLSTVAATDVLYLQKFQEKITQLVISYDANNSIAERSSFMAPHCSVTLTPEGALVIRSNIESREIGFLDLDRRLERMFNIITVQAKRDSQEHLRRSEKELQQYVGKHIPIDVDFDNFANTEQFMEVSQGYPMQQANMMATLYTKHIYWWLTAVGEEVVSLAGVCATIPEFKKFINERVTRIVTTYDPNSSIGMGISESDPGSHFAVELIGSELRCSINLVQWESFLENAGKKLVLLIAALNEIDKQKDNVTKAEKSFVNALGKPVSLTVDWNSWVKHNDFLALGVPKMKEVINQISHFSDSVVAPYINIKKYQHEDNLVNTTEEDTSSVLSAVLNGILRMFQHPISKKAFMDKISRIDVTQGPESASIVKDELRVNVDFRGGVSVCSYKLMYSYEWALDTTFPTYKALAIEKIAEHQKNIFSAASVQIDWDDLLQEEKFNHSGPVGSLLIIQNLCNMAKHLCLEFKRLAAHPLGAELIKSKIHNIVLNYSMSPITTPERNAGGILSVKGTSLHIKVDEKAVLAALSFNFQDAVRFQYGTLVQEAIYDGKAEVMRLRGKLEFALGRALPVDIDFAWTEHASFRNLIYTDQYHSVLHVQTKLLRALVERSDGILSLINHPTGIPKDSINKEIEKLSIVVAPEKFKGTELPRAYGENPVNVNQRSIHDEYADGPTSIGELSKRGGSLKFEIPLQDVYISSIAVDWKDRILDVFDLIVAIGQCESEPTFRAHCAAIASAVGSNIPINFNQDVYTKKPEFLRMKPDVRTQLVKETYTTLIEKVFLGDYGLTGKFGLAEFAESRAHIQKSIKSINIVVEHGTTQHNAITLKQDAIYATFNSELLLKKEVSPGGPALETALGLRRLKEDAVFKEGSGVASTNCGPFARELGASPAFVIDWETLRSHSGFKNTTDILEYVKVARTFTNLFESLLVSHSSSSLISFIKAFQPLKAAIASNITKFVLRASGSSSDLVIPQRDGSTIFLDVPFEHFDAISAGTHLDHYKERILDFFGLTLAAVQHERNAQFQATGNQVRAALNKNITIAVRDWDFTQTPAFTKYTPTERYDMLTFLHTELANTLLEGENGFTGLCFFSSIAETLRNNINSIEIVVGSGSTPITIANGVCTFFYSVEDLHKKNVVGGYHHVEDTLKLRESILAEVIKEQNKHISDACNDKLKTTVNVDWSSLKTDKYEYVREVREAADLVIWAFVGESLDRFGYWSVYFMCQRSSDVKKAVKSGPGFKIVFGPGTSNVGKSKTLFS